MKQTILYFGSFNPIHNGHVALAEYALQKCKADELWLMISPNNPLKESTELWDENLRLRLARAGVQGKQGIVVSDFEFHLPRPSYTAVTLRALTEDFPEHRFSLLIGSDNMALFTRWREWEYIYQNYPIFVYPRQGDDLDALAQQYPKMHILADAPLYDISSTQIRQMLKKGEDIQDFVPFDIKMLNEQTVNN